MTLANEDSISLAPKLLDVLTTFGSRSPLVVTDTLLITLLATAASVSNRDICVYALDRMRDRGYKVDKDIASSIIKKGIYTSIYLYI
jgi:hypothetical protein